MPISTWNAWSRSACGCRPSTRAPSARGAEYVRRVEFDFHPGRRQAPLERAIERFPMCRPTATRLYEDCYEAYNIQVQGLVTRLDATRANKLVVGVSGGLDSTQALLVACRAFDLLGKPRGDIEAVTLPGFATGEQSKGYALALMDALGVTAREVDIRPLAMQLLKDLDHPFARGEPVYDLTFENVQAGRAHRLPVPPRRPDRRLRAGHRRPVGTGAGLGHLRRRRPHEPLQRQRLGPQDPDPAT
ncbi:MAG: hypothetical protein WDN45_17270 [Caulobacteraceae bacterium]